MKRSRYRTGNYFSIFAHGERFDPDAFLKTSALRPDRIWRRGDLRPCACVESRHETSGVEFTLGDGWAVPFHKQEEAAISYLHAHQAELRALGKFPGVETFILGFEYVCKLNEGVLGMCMGPSAHLMSQALDIGLRPTYYVSFDCTQIDAELERWRRAGGAYARRGRGRHRRSRRHASLPQKMN